MAFKFVALATLVIVANAGALPVTYHSIPVAQLSYAHPAPYGYPVPVDKTIFTKAVDLEYDPHPEYNFSYNVHDTLTGDAKTQEESRHGDVVEGSYSLVEADGSRRVVHYKADDINGFNAIVEKQPATVAIKSITPALHDGHVAYKTAPIYHSASVYQSPPEVYHAAAKGHNYATPVADEHIESAYHH